MSILTRYPNAVFLDYEKIINVNSSFNYLNQKLSNINLRILYQDSFYSILMTPSKTHGYPVNNATQAKNKYNINKRLVRNFVNNIPKFNRSIKTILIDFYENS
jgi:hypothetical protein